MSLGGKDSNQSCAATMGIVLGYGPGFEMAKLAERLLIVGITRKFQD